MNEQLVKRTEAGLTSSRWLINGVRILVGVTFISSWQTLSGTFVEEVFLSKPSIILIRLIDDVKSLVIVNHLKVTFTEIAIGYVIGGMLGLVLGYIMARSRFLFDVFEPYIMAFYSIPKVALAPLFILWLGIGLTSKVAMVIMMVYFLVFFNTFAGIRAVNEEFVQLALVMGATKRQVAWRVILPAATPFIMIGFKASVPFAVIGAMIGEFTASSMGIGYYILYSAGTYDAAGVFAGIAALLVVVFIANYFLGLLEAHLLRWRPEVETRVIV